MLYKSHKNKYLFKMNYVLVNFYYALAKWIPKYNIWGILQLFAPVLCFYPVWSWKGLPSFMAVFTIGGKIPHRRCKKVINTIRTHRHHHLCATLPTGINTSESLCFQFSLTYGKWRQQSQKWRDGWPGKHLFFYLYFQWLLKLCGVCIQKKYQQTITKLNLYFPR